jgi:DNA-binding NtrC family response regulator
MATRRVLIVDDESDVRKTLRDIIRAMRYAEPLEVEEAPGGREGLDAVVRQRPDLVLLDLQMPRMDGLALLKQIREVEPRLPVIVISATQDNKMSTEALRNGAVAYLPKPFDSRHVEMLVTTFLDSTKPRATPPARGA